MVAGFVLLLTAGVLARGFECNNFPGSSCQGDEASLLQSGSQGAAAVKAHVQKKENEKEIQQHNASSSLQHSKHSSCGKDTGGKCGWTTCDASRGGPHAVECTTGWWKICQCKEGYCAVDGKCVLEYKMGYEATLEDTYCEDKGVSCQVSSEEEAHRKCSADASCTGVYHPANHPQDWMLCKAPLRTMESRDGSTVTPKK